MSPLRAALTLRFAKNPQHDTSKVLCLPRKMTSEVSKVEHMPRKMQRIFPKRCKSIAPATQNQFWEVMKHVGMSQSATLATRNEATRSWKTSKMTPCAELTRGTAIATSRGHLRNGCGRLRPVANCCDWLRMVANGCERLRDVWRTQLNPYTPGVKREPLLRIRENMWRLRLSVLSTPFCVLSFRV